LDGIFDVKKWFVIILKTGVSAGLIWVLLSGVDFQSLKIKFDKINLTLVLVAMGAIMAQIFIGTLRWMSVLKGLGANVMFFALAKLYYIGVFFNQALPGGTGGDAVRVFLSYREGVNFRHAFNGVFLERVATVLALIALVDITQPFFIESLSEEMASVSLTSAIIISLGGIVGVILLTQLYRFPERIQHWSIIRGLGNLGRDLRLIFFSFKRAGPPLFWSLVGHINVSFSVFLLATSLRLNVSLFDCIILVPPVLLILSIPISIGGWGVREGAMVWAFALVGVPKEAALALSLLFGIVVLLTALPGGVVWLVTRKGDNNSSSIPKGAIGAIQDQQEKT
tara:strand:- start:3128 stop:4141 length:1014 start_codon:yes stop_codon:yes gene_type:complete